MTNNHLKSHTLVENEIGTGEFVKFMLLIKYYMKIIQLISQMKPCIALNLRQKYSKRFYKMVVADKLVVKP